jgi:hypothetical protein
LIRKIFEKIYSREKKKNGPRRRKGKREVETARERKRHRPNIYKDTKS